MEKRLKICFITYSIFAVGGAQRVLSVLANELQGKYDVEILCTDGQYREDRSMYNLNKDVKVEICSEITKKSLLSRIISKIIRVIHRKSKAFDNERYDNFITRIYYNKDIQENLIRYINYNKYDIVIGVEGYFSMLIALINDRIKAKTIGWEHSSYKAYLETPNRYYWKQDRLFKKYLPRLSKHIVLTKEDRELFKKELNIDSETIYNPLSFSSREKSKCCNKNIIFVGRLVESKGLELLIEAFKIVYDKRPDWSLYIVGDGPDKNKLMKKVDISNLKNNVFLVGKTKKVLEHYLNSSIFVSSSILEGFGVVITEAMECGLPVVAFENSGPKEIINKNYNNGILVECKDIKSLAEAIIYLIDDKNKRVKMGLQASIRAKDFDIKYISKQWGNILDEV